MKKENNLVDRIPNKNLIEKSEKKYITKKSKITKALINNLKIENNRFLYMLNQIPFISHAFKYEKGFKAVIPEKFKEGLKNGTLRLLKGVDNTLISTIVDSNGNFVHQIRLEEFNNLVNPVELSPAMNQICMQMQLDEIQKSISEFRIEIIPKLNEILKNFHDDRIAIADSLESSFIRFKRGEEISKGQLLIKIDDAKAFLFKDINGQMESLKKYDINKIDEEKNNDIQTKISYLLEDLNSINDVLDIELNLQQNNNKKYYEIINNYSDTVSETLTLDNLNYLNALSDFSSLKSYLEIKNNIWENEYIPRAKNFFSQYEGVRKFLSGENKICSEKYHGDVEKDNNKKCSGKYHGDVEKHITDKEDYCLLCKGRMKAKEEEEKKEKKAKKENICNGLIAAGVVVQTIIPIGKTIIKKIEQKKSKKN